MKMIGNEVYIQRGEIWSLDFEVVDKKGHPLAILKNWKNPYIVITVAASLYEQKGDYRESYWLDIDKMWVENEEGEIGSELISRKRFTSAEALPLDYTPANDGSNMGFSLTEVLLTYKNLKTDGSDFDVKNYLFYVDPLNDGNYRYAYLTSYEMSDKDDDKNGIKDVNSETWEEYDFRIVKRFTTRDWMEQSYLYDIKIVAGESVQEGVTRILNAQNVQETIKTDEWTQSDWKEYLDMIEDEAVRAEMWQLYNDGAPLMPGFDTESILLDPTKIYVSVNLQGGIK